MIRRCCCGNTPCEISDCTSVRSHCCSVGLQPFEIAVTASMRPTTCSEYTATYHQCTAENCSSWGTVDCGGCSPCDPTGSAPGANGRTCPCKDSDCAKPAGRQIPILNCNKVEAGTLDECRYSHLDYWYMTFDPGGNAACDLPTTPPCPWLGSVSCAYSLVHVPAGSSRVQCRTISGSGGLLVDRLYACDGEGNTALPVPLCKNPLRYGWPIDCDFAPPLPEGCACICDCDGGTLGTFELFFQSLNTCEVSSAYATLTFAAPCGNTPGTILCGHGCDTCAASYLGLFIQMTSRKKAVGVYGDPNFVEAEPPYDALCESLGITNSVPPGSECDAGSQFDPNLCADKCCECSRQWYVVLRKYRTAADGNLCTMAKGKYEIVGTSLCGSGGPHYPCNTAGIGGVPPCIDGLPACADPGAWASYFDKLGLNLEVEIL